MNEELKPSHIKIIGTDKHLIFVTLTVYLMLHLKRLLYLLPYGLIVISRLQGIYQPIIERLIAAVSFTALYHKIGPQGFRILVMGVTWRLTIAYENLAIRPE